MSAVPQLVSKNMGVLVTAWCSLVVAGGGWYYTSKSSEAELLEKQVQFDATQQTNTNQVRSDALTALETKLLPKLKDDDARKIAALAAYHSCYGEFVDTRPVLMAFAQSMSNEEANREVRRLAQRVARQHVHTLLAAGGESRRLRLSVEPGKRSWEDLECARHEIRIALTGHVVCNKLATDHVGVEFAQKIDHNGDFEVLESFSLGYLDTPIRDKIAVQHGDGALHFFALILRSLTEQNGKLAVEIDVVHFPEGVGTAAALRWRNLRKLAEVKTTGGSVLDHGREPSSKPTGH